MNVKIFEIIQRLNGIAGLSWSEEDKEELALQIVKECVDILDKPGAMKMDPTTLSPYNEGWVNGRLLAIEHLKEHFGIE